jgi:arginine/lysine/histidine/glutamine transport system substrate-binding/permease protein
MRLDVILEALPKLLAGAGVTVQLTVIVIFFGLIGGSLMGIARLSPIPAVRIVTRIYVDFFRGTPLLVQIFMVYFGIPSLIQSMGSQFSFSRPVAAILALSLNATAYIAEIVRSGIQSIELGQREASESLGLSPMQTMGYVIFPQAFRRIIPPLGNEFITLLKDTSLVAIISYEELFREAQLAAATNYRYFELFGTVALVYLVMVVVLSQCFSWLENLLNPANRGKRAKPKPVVEEV